MDDQWFVKCTGSADVGCKSIALPLHVIPGPLAQAVIVQAGFANTHNAWQLTALQQIVQAGFGDAFVVGMDTHRCPKIIITRCQAMNVVELLQGGADAERPVYQRQGHRVADLGKLAFQLGKSQVAVGVCEHGRMQFQSN